MARVEGGIIAQIWAFRTEETRRKELAKAQKLRELEAENREIQEAELRLVEALGQSFLTLKPAVEPLLRELAEEYRDENNQPLDHPQVETIEPYISDTVFHPGHFALIWGSPIMPDSLEDAIARYTQVNEQLVNGKKLSRRQEELRRTNGDRKVRISGFNTIVFIAETEYGSRGLVPVLYLRGTDITPKRISAWLSNTRITDVNIAPFLSRPLAHPTNQTSVSTSVAEFVNVGPQNIRPTGPFV